MKVFLNLLALFYSSKEERHFIRDFYNKFISFRKINKTHQNYIKVQGNLRRLNKKVRVLFLVNEIAKWKTKSLYELMMASSEFEPLIAVTAGDLEISANSSAVKRKAKINSLIKYFKSRNINYVIAYDTDADQEVDLKKFNPGIVFYQQPWGICPKHKPQTVSEFAITCYVPYYVENYCILPMDYFSGFHPYLFKYYLLNRDYAYMFSQIFPEFKGEFSGAGHTALDLLSKDYTYTMEGGGKIIDKQKIVIYAPHWSFKHPLNPNSENYSTFLLYGKVILNFAKQNDNIKWIFKPHPSLRFALLRTEVMSAEDIDDYYAQWAMIGEVSEGSEYYDLFNCSDLLITDCGSFITEYYSTGKPILHLYSEYGTKPFPYMKPLFESLYTIKSWNQFTEIFDSLLYSNNDPQKRKRLELIKFYELNISSAAENIINDLRKLLI